MSALDRLQSMVEAQEQSDRKARLALWTQMQEQATEIADMVKELHALGMQPKVVYYEQDGGIIHGRETDFPVGTSTGSGECKKCDFCCPPRVNHRDTSAYPYRGAK
jgi:hypothetical protein